MNILEVKNLCKKYKGFELKNINLELPSGYIMGYVGQNGAGKTTTINLITHICKGSSDAVKVNGLTYEGNEIEYKESIGYVGDESYFPKNFKIKDVRKLLKQFYKSFDGNKFDEMIQNWQLPLNKTIDKFSRGMKVKLMFATIFSRDTKLLILDEATNGLDPVVRDDLLSMLQEYIEDGKRSILFSTHMLSDLEQISDFIVFIDDGEIILNRTKEEFEEDYMLIKGDENDLSRVQKEKLIGLTTGKYGFEAIINSEDAQLFDSRFTFDKPEISQIMIHSIRERRNKNAGN